ncbi:MAG: adenylate/guanylate cyclase domain-containing protein [Burkholderiales bacterium]|nr:adenylate/guanylate cyclase domain-containing protein [Burkholderiales bacterium]
MSEPGSAPSAAAATESSRRRWRFEPLRLNSLESRIVVFFVVLLMGVQLAVFLSIRAAIEQVARDKIQEELQVGQRVFKRLLDQNSQQLVEATSVLTYDFGFREAIATRDQPTILSALGNHARRIKANGMTLVGLDNVVVADTLLADSAGKTFMHPELIAEAQQFGRASAIRQLQDKVYQIVVVPVLAPLPISWVAMAFVIDDQLARDLQRITGLDVSFVGLPPSGPPRVAASTVGQLIRGQLLLDRSIYAQHGGSFTREAAGDTFQMLGVELTESRMGGVHAVLQRALSEHMVPYGRLQVILMFLSAISLAITLFGAMRIARRIIRPVTQLADAARLMSRGEYVHTIHAAQGDEIGELASAFNTMAKGIAERDTVRDILGKVMSQAVAEQLLSQQIELGGEEREVTVLFADIRNFTELCESLTPTQTLALLNRYLTEINAVIEANDGVIDKYTGDGVMALFGAPIARADDAGRAMQAAMAIVARIGQLGRQLADEGLPHPDIGIGINTARVIAGNIGSASRLNYTVLGDGVNLAARLEGLTKRYQVPIVAGEVTRARLDRLVWRELDKVRVKGKTVPVRIYQPLGATDSLSNIEAQLLDRYHAAVAAYRERRWSEARTAFTALLSQPYYRRLAGLYLGYLDEAEREGSSEDWDGSFTLYEK